MNHTTMDRSEIDNTDLQLMKIMIFGSLRSKYQIQKETQKDARVATIPYATLQRKLKRLKNYEMIKLVDRGTRKDGKPDRRNPERWDLSLKGMTYLMLNGELKEQDLNKAVDRLLELRIFQVFRPLFAFSEFKIGVRIGLIEAISEMRCKINFRFFNENYTANLFLESAKEGFFNHFHKNKKLILRFEQLLRKYRMLQKDILEIAETELKRIKRERGEIDRTISQYNQVIDFVRNIKNNNSNPGVQW